MRDVARGGGSDVVAEVRLAPGDSHAKAGRRGLVFVVEFPECLLERRLGVTQVCLVDGDPGSDDLVV